MMRKIFLRVRASLYFHLVRKCFSYHPEILSNNIYLTFDDGPDPDITDFILDELRKYCAKATFFCCGNNMIKNKPLLDRIISEGHTVANHTFSHINGLRTPVNDYVEDVRRVDDVCQTVLFRPPWGQMNIREYAKLRDKKIVLWDLESGDVTKDFNKDALLAEWKEKVKPGSVILFHFSAEHAERTKDLLPAFLGLFSQQGYIFTKING